DTSAGIVVTGQARVDAGGGDAAGIGTFTPSTGANNFTGFSQGSNQQLGPQAIVNQNAFIGTPSPTIPVSTATGNVAAQGNTFTGATNSADVEKVIYHRLDSPFSAYVDYRNASGAAALAAPSIVPGSFRFVAATTDRNDPVAQFQRSMIQGISFQF